MAGGRRWTEQWMGRRSAWGRTPRRPARLAVLLLALATVVPLVDAWLGGDLVGDPVDSLLVAAGGALVGAWLSWRWAVGACATGAALLTWANQVAHPGQYSAVNDLFFFAVLVGGPALAGALVTARARQVRELRRLAQVRAEQRDAEVRAARLDERNRVETAVTESMMQRLGGLVVQASGARSGPLAGDTLEALHRIEESGRATLDDLRDALGSLRACDEDLPGAAPLDTTGGLPATPRLGPVDLLVAGCGVPVAIEAVAGSAAHGPPLANVLAGLAVGAPLLVRRTHPLSSAAATFAVAAAMTEWLTPLTSAVSVLLPMSLVAFALGAHTRGRRRGAAAGVLLAGGLAVVLASPPGARAADGILPTLVWAVVAFGAGILAAQHTDRGEWLRDLLHQIEAGRGSSTRLAVAEQRQAIARDLHDTVAHAMTVVCLHAEAAQRQWGEAGAVETSLTAIELASRQAMLRLREGLASLEDDEGVVARLLVFADSLGVRVTVQATGLTRPLDVGQERLVERVVREALVNAARHAPGAPVQVILADDGASLCVEVSNHRVDVPAYGHGSGTGLLGLGELVREHGGRLEHGATDGRFRVAASLPVLPGVPA